MYRVVVVTVLYAVPNAYVQQFASITTSCTAAVISLVIIMILNKVSHNVLHCPLTHLWLTHNDNFSISCSQLYERVALYLTELGECLLSAFLLLMRQSL